MTRERMNEIYWTGYLNEPVAERKHESGLVALFQVAKARAK